MLLTLVYTIITDVHTSINTYVYVTNSIILFYYTCYVYTIISVCMLLVVILCTIITVVFAVYECLYCFEVSAFC